MPINKTTKKRKASLRKSKSFNRRHSSILQHNSIASLDEMIVASRVIIAQNEGRTPDVDFDPQKVKKIVASVRPRVLRGDRLVERSLNHAIVLQNAKEHKPSSKARLLYKKIFDSD